MDELLRLSSHPGTDHISRTSPPHPPSFVVDSSQFFVAILSRHDDCAFEPVICLVLLFEMWEMGNRGASQTITCAYHHVVA